MIAGESIGLPQGWAIDAREDEEGPRVYVATFERRLIGQRELRFESTALGDLIDQVLEALDAWQTELELAQAEGPRVVFGRAV